jgi:hypothetical protein
MLTSPQADAIRDHISESMLVSHVTNQIAPAGQSVIYWCRHLQHSLLPILENWPRGCDLRHRTDAYARTYQFCATICWYGGRRCWVSTGSIYVPNDPKNAETNIENCKIWLHSSRDDFVRIQRQESIPWKHRDPLPSKYKSASQFCVGRSLSGTLLQ